MAKRKRIADYEQILTKIADALDNAIQNRELTCFNALNLQTELNKFLGRTVKTINPLKLELVIPEETELPAGSDPLDYNSYEVTVKDKSGKKIYVDYLDLYED